MKRERERNRTEQNFSYRKFSTKKNQIHRLKMYGRVSYKSISYIIFVAVAKKDEKKFWFLFIIIFCIHLSLSFCIQCALLLYMCQYMNIRLSKQLNNIFHVMMYLQKSNVLYFYSIKFHSDVNGKQN